MREFPALRTSKRQEWGSWTPGASPRTCRRSPGCVTAARMITAGRGFAPHVSRVSQVEIPLWLGADLHKKKMMHVELPKHYQQRFREHLEAGPASINLRELSSHYFAVGEKLAGSVPPGICQGPQR